MILGTGHVGGVWLLIRSFTEKPPQSDTAARHNYLSQQYILTEERKWLNDWTSVIFWIKKYIYFLTQTRHFVNCRKCRIERRCFIFACRGQTHPQTETRIHGGKGKSSVQQTEWTQGRHNKCSLHSKHQEGLHCVRVCIFWTAHSVTPAHSFATYCFWQPQRRLRILFPFLIVSLFKFFFCVRN